MTVPTGADLVVAELFRHGARVLFGMPGSHTTALYDAIHRHGGIRTVLVRNEQAGAFMADGHARVTGAPGVICTTAGPGATNALTGIAEAWADSVPVLLLSGQVNHDRLHEECGNYHEIDLEAILRPCVKFVTTTMSHRAIPAAVASAFAALTQGRPRPAALVLPQDLMTMPVTAPIPPLAPLPKLRCTVADAALDEAAKLLAEAQRPLILAGGGAIWSGAASVIRELAQKLGCPVVTSLNGKGILDERDPLSLGHARSPRGQAAWNHADLVLALGCRFTEVMTKFRTFQPPAKLIQVDLDPTQIGMNYPVTQGIVGDVRDVVEGVLARIEKPRSDWSAIWLEARAARPAKPEWLIDTLRANLPDDAVVFTDASEMAYRMHTDYPAYAPRTFFYPSNFIALGWGFPAALGAAVALPGRVVVSFSGDGGFVMTCQELATAVRYQLHVIIIVHNDSAYGAIKNLQRIKHESRYHDTELNNPDFLQLAAAFGVFAQRATDAASFAAALRDAIARKGPTLIEVPDDWRYLRA